MLDAGCAPAVDSVTLFGHALSLTGLGLPVLSAVLGLVDGFNPCSMWVLVFMLCMLAPLRDRRRMLAIAGTFVLVEGLAYFAFLATWLNTFLLVGVSRASEVAVGLFGCVVGAIHIKDFVAFGRGLSLSIPAAAKPGIYARIRRIVVADTLAAAITATVLLALLVQIVEFMCTAGIPALYTRILTLHEIEGWRHYAYISIYVAMYMLDDILVLGVGVVTLSQRRLQEREGRLLKLLSGSVLVGLGIALLMRG